MEENQQLKAQILNVLTNKSQVKYKVFDNSVEAFKMLKHLLAETEKNLNAQITGLDSRVKLEYKENGRLHLIYWFLIFIPIYLSLAVNTAFGKPLLLRIL